MSTIQESKLKVLEDFKSNYEHVPFEHKDIKYESSFAKKLSYLNVGLFKTKKIIIFKEYYSNRAEYIIDFPALHLDKPDHDVLRVVQELEDLELYFFSDYMREIVIQSVGWIEEELEKSNLVEIDKQIKQCIIKLRTVQDTYIRESYLLLIELNKLQKTNEKK